MLNEMHAPAKADAVTVMPVYKRTGKTGIRTTGAKRVMAEATTKRMAWVTQVAAVRDAKDKAAFAELFA